jgi:hypothetical protein
MDADQNWPTITDEMMVEYRTSTQPYTLVILNAGPQSEAPGADKIIWEHGRRFLAMRAAGLLPLILPVADGSGVWGAAIFNADPDAVQRIMAQDPAVQAAVLTFEVHPTRSFPGDALPRPAGAEEGEDGSGPGEPAMRHLGILFHYPRPEYRAAMLHGFLNVARIMNAQEGVEAGTYEEVETGALVAVTRYASLEAVQEGFRAVAAAGIDPEHKPDVEARPRELHRLVVVQARE